MNIAIIIGKEQGKGTNNEIARLMPRDIPIHISCCNRKSLLLLNAHPHHHHHLYLHLILLLYVLIYNRCDLNRFY